MTLAVIDWIPLWAVYLVTVLLLFMAAETAFLLGRKRREEEGETSRGSSGTVLGAILGLLAFLLAFTFGMAHSVHKERQVLVNEEANALATAYLRTDLVPEAQGKELRKLLREYVQIRVDATQAQEYEDLVPMIARSEQIHRQLWDVVKQLVHSDAGPVYAGLMVNAVQAVIDVHAKRLTAATRAQIPASIMITLYFIALLAMGLVGVQAGKSRARSMVPRVLLILAFSSVLLLIIELDRPAKTMIQVNQQAMMDLQQKMQVGTD